jgi:hypothetical protein
MRGYQRVLASASLLFFGLGLSATQAVGQELKQKLVGTWTMVSADNVRADGTKAPIFGSNPKGTLMLDGNGHYSLQFMRSDLPKFASNSRIKGTPEENTAIVHGMVAHFGRYSVNEADRTLVFHIDSGSFPNWSGTEQKRQFTLNGDELKYSDARSSAGGAAELIWKQAR